MHGHTISVTLLSALVPASVTLLAWVLATVRRPLPPAPVPVLVPVAVDRRKGRR